MRSLPVLCLLVVLAFATSASARADDVLLPDCGTLGYGGRVAPADWSAGCTAGTTTFEQLSWSGWGSPLAVATGTSVYDGCLPTCATAPIHLYPAEVRAEQIRRCASSLGTRRYYTRITMVTTFPPDNPDGKPAGPSEPYVFTVECPRPGYLVGLGTRHARLGPFVDDGPYDANGIELLFGEPASTRREQSSLCRKRWPRLGMTVDFVVFGSDDDPCEAGYFARAVLTAHRWHTPDGVRPGGSARQAAHHSSRRCTRDRCGITGYGFALHRSECAPGRYPGVIAQTGQGRVTRLLVFMRWCE